MVDDKRLLILDSDDNVAIITESIGDGEVIIISGQTVSMTTSLPMGHKLARRAITVGDAIIKNGMPIGNASVDIAVGTHVHVQNVRSAYTTVEQME